MSRRRCGVTLVVTAVGAAVLAVSSCSFPAGGDVACTVSECRGEDAVTCHQEREVSPPGTVVRCAAGSTCTMLEVRDLDPNYVVPDAAGLLPFCVPDVPEPCAPPPSGGVESGAFCRDNRPAQCLPLAHGQGTVLLDLPCPEGSQCTEFVVGLGSTMAVCAEQPQAHCSGQDQYDFHCVGNVMRACVVTPGIEVWTLSDCGARFCNEDDYECSFEPVD